MKTIFITGGSTGIGRATVIKFLAEGWNVAFADINDKKAESLISQTAETERLLYGHADTRDREALKEFLALAADRFGHIDSVFANAGIHRNNTLLDISDDELHKIIDINLYGTINTLQACIPHIINAGGGSVVINCSDQWYIGKPNSFAYGLTKGALGQMTRSLSIDLAKYDIRVNAVCAGSIETPLLDGALQRASQRQGGLPLDELYRLENEQYPRRRMGQPEEVAEMVYFLASDKSSFSTGGHFLIDGGLVAR